MALVRCGLFKWFLMKGKQSIGSQFILFFVLFFFALNKQLAVKCSECKRSACLGEKRRNSHFHYRRLEFELAYCLGAHILISTLSLLWAIVLCVPRAPAFLEVVGGKGFKRWTPPQLGSLWIDKSAIICFYESSSLHLRALSQSERERSSCSCWLAGDGLLTDCR